MAAFEAVRATPRYADGGPQVLSKKLTGSGDKSIRANRCTHQALVFEQTKPCDAWTSLSNAAARANRGRGR